MLYYAKFASRWVNKKNKIVFVMTMLKLEKRAGSLSN